MHDNLRNGVVVEWWEACASTKRVTVREMQGGKERACMPRDGRGARDMRNRNARPRAARRYTTATL